MVEYRLQCFINGWTQDVMFNLESNMGRFVLLIVERWISYFYYWLNIGRYVLSTVQYRSLCYIHGWKRVVIFYRWLKKWCYILLMINVRFIECHASGFIDCWLQDLVFYWWLITRSCVLLMVEYMTLKTRHSLSLIFVYNIMRYKSLNKRCSILLMVKHIIFCSIHGLKQDLIFDWWLNTGRKVLLMFEHKS